MKIATTIGEMYPYVSAPAEAVRAYEGTGFRHLDYSFYNVLYPGSPFLGDDWRREVEDAGNAAAALGFRFVQAHSPAYNPLDPAADHEAGLRATLRSIEACGMLGIPNIVVHSGYTTRLTYPASRDAYFQENLAFYRSLYPAMEKYGVRVLIENSAEGNMGSRYFFMTGEEMADFLQYAGHPLLGACWDTGHGNMRGADQYRELTSLGTFLQAVHIQDNHGGADEHIAPFFGTVSMDAVLRGLLAVQFQGYFTFESDNFLPRRPAGDGPLASAPLSVKRASLALLYEIGRACLSAYGCCEE
ncbi:MAG: sugar phosphate isomerase/epimerase family protein [Eubacteriales bacterium]